MLLSIQIRGKKKKKKTIYKKELPPWSVHSLLMQQEIFGYLHYCRCSSTEKQMFKEREQNVRVWKIMPVKRVSDWPALKKMGKQCSSKLCQDSHHSKGAKDLRSSGQHSRTKGVGPTAVSEHNEPLLNIH